MHNLEKSELNTVRIEFSYLFPYYNTHKQETNFAPFFGRDFKKAGDTVRLSA